MVVDQNIKLIAMLNKLKNIRTATLLDRKALRTIKGGGVQNTGICLLYPELGPIPCDELCPDGTAPICAA
ncbi:hypothetical protein SAMN02927921_04150 [Sinomicrobium oceani]|uniref:Uncharacterized protein n=2 Tax=Sinomicrobium oceani TaxID=1150368 RepID=A0A1K1RXG6_9FLAO|nr:hypothetical protein SAMN02927921_04150 [Sinomicrobium oceani]